ncbi:MAG: DUF2892 domain-containing protein [Sinobacteraceae bacterium]|nr:DUF2892 domain-containing protein [Nevskiaceae bacterium]
MNSREYAGNLSANERTWSAVIGTAVPLLLMRRGSPLLSTLAAAAGIGLVARAFTGHCAVKDAINRRVRAAGEMAGGRNQLRSRDGRGTQAPDAQEYVEEQAYPEGVQESP